MKTPAKANHGFAPDEHNEEWTGRLVSNEGFTGRSLANIVSFILEPLISRKT